MVVVMQSGGRIERVERIKAKRKKEMARNKEMVWNRGQADKPFKADLLDLILLRLFLVLLCLLPLSSCVGASVPLLRA